MYYYLADMAISMHLQIRDAPLTSKHKRNSQQYPKQYGNNKNIHLLLLPAAIAAAACIIATRRISQIQFLAASTGANHNICRN
jgi:hypothetical protein